MQSPCNALDQNADPVLRTEAPHHLHNGMLVKEFSCPVTAPQIPTEFVL